MSKGSQPEKYARLIKAESKRLGFQYCGFAKAQFLAEEAPRLEAWLKKNMHGKMHYMQNHFDKRLDPSLLVPGAKTVVSLLLNYFPEQKQKNPDAPQISKYAYGADYHFVIKQKLKELLNFIREEIGEVNGRAFVDSAPVMDKVWAKKSGLGWIGKHSNLINKNQGSFLFIAELIIDLKLEYNEQEIPDYCGTCTACMDACPTEAIADPYFVDGSKCISYYTIELKDELLPQAVKGKFENWAFGCDICQDVCPWNRFSKPHNEPLFNPHPDLLSMTHNEWHELTEEVFQTLFKNSAVKRTKYEGLKRNLKFLKQSE